MSCCPDCSGSGSGDCSRCKGTGEEITYGGAGHNKPCENDCDDGKCPRCQGTGKI